MKTLYIILIALFALACSHAAPKTYTVEYEVRAVSQYGDTTILAQTVRLTDHKVEWALYQGDLRFMDFWTGDVTTVMSGVRYFEILKADTINIR